MSKGIFVFLILGTTIFSKNRLEFQIENVKKKTIEILLKKEKTATGEYKVVKGDTLSELALKLNNSMKTLMELNSIENKDLIIEGEVLKYLILEEAKDES